MAKMLIVDDERELCRILSRLLSERGHDVSCAHSGEAAIAVASHERPDLVLLDLNMNGIDGIETLKQLTRRVPGLPVVMMTAFGDVTRAVHSMKLGALDFVTKPFQNDWLLDSIDRLLALQQHPRLEDSLFLVGESPAFREVMDLARKFAIPDINVLLQGETGTGKELFARTLHAASKRCAAPFVPVDCSMLAENLLESELFGHEKGAFTGAIGQQIGRFERAQGGTLFLDEIGNLPIAFQAKLLRVLQERRFERVGGRETIRLDVRLIAATHVDLQEAIHQGRFRQDLYYRLNEMTVCLPPLRKREGDAIRIAEHFLNRYAMRFGKSIGGFSAEARACLERYPWPGNVRELENAIKSAVVLAEDRIGPEQLPAEVRGSPETASAVVLPTEHKGQLRVQIDLGVRVSQVDLKAIGAEAAEQAERSLLCTLLARKPMSGAELARMLGVDPKTLRLKLRRYGLETT